LGRVAAALVPAAGRVAPDPAASAGVAGRALEAVPATEPVPGDRLWCRSSSMP